MRDRFSRVVVGPRRERAHQVTGLRADLDLHLLALLPVAQEEVDEVTHALS
ncbi:MAG: hypothetical protein ACO38D_02870 [Ilumatobacteraceae bacterium]